MMARDDDEPRGDLPRGIITLPEAALHPSQVEALELIRGNRRVALVAGRRWGKSTILITFAVDAALSGKRGTKSDHAAIRADMGIRADRRDATRRCRRHLASEAC